MMEEGWLSRLVTVTNRFQEFKTSSCGSATNLLMAYVKDGYVTRSPKKNDDTTTTTTTNERPVASFRLRQPLTPVVERCQDMLALADGSSRQCYVGEDDTNKSVVVVTVPSALLSTLQQDGSRYQEHYQRQLQMHRRLSPKNPLVATAWADAAFVEEGAGIGAGIGAGTVYCTESLDEWQPLSSVLRQRGPMGTQALLPVARLWMTQLVAGLADIHAQHIVVRDLRPDNLFVSADGLSIKLGSLAVAGVTSALSPPNTTASEQYIHQCPRPAPRHKIHLWSVCPSRAKPTVCPYVGA
jgi:serine/threonine protein kinase